MAANIGAALGGRASGRNSRNWWFHENHSRVSGPNPNALMVPATVLDLLLEKGDGTVELVLWGGFLVVSMQSRRTWVPLCRQGEF
jgi:hypothetical protein